MQERKGKILCTKTKEKEARSCFQKQMEEVWKMKEGALATNSMFRLYAFRNACKYCNLKWNEMEGILVIRDREFCCDECLAFSLVGEVPHWYIKKGGRVRIKQVRGRVKR